MKLLITYKPVHYQRTRGSYAGLAEFDLERGVFDRVLRLPAPASMPPLTVSTLSATWTRSPRHCPASCGRETCS